MKQSALKRAVAPAILLIIGSFLFVLIERHFVEQAFSQGFVLGELRPVMDTAVNIGGFLYRWGGRPLFVGAVAVAFLALARVISLWLGGKGGVKTAYAWPVIAVVAFLLMYSIGGTHSFPLYLFGMAAVPALGWVGEHCGDDAESENRSQTAPEKAALAMIVLLGLLVRFYKVDIFPRLYSIDEQLLAQAALQIGEETAFFAEPHIMKPHLLRLASIYASFKAFGVGVFQHRTVSVLEGTLCILLVYLVSRRLWDSRAGLFGAFLVAMDPWFIGHSRFGAHEIEGPVFLLLLLYLIIRAVRRGGRGNFALLGAVSGATIYLYLSCLVMAPFSFGAALVGRFLSARERRPALFGEAAAMVGAMVLAALPYFTLGRENIGELNQFYSAGGNFLTAAKDYGWNPAFMLFVNFWRSVEYLIEWGPRVRHPSGTFYPNPISMGLALMGLGVLLRMRKSFENLLVLVWVPVAFLPMMLSYGFAERRLFATLGPIPAMLGGLLLARLWNSGDESRAAANLRRALLLPLLGVLVLTSLFITFADTDPTSGGTPHPKKVAEFVRSLPPSYSVIISNRIKEFPFLLYLTNYEKMEASEEPLYSFVEFEELRPMADEIASSSGVAVVTDPGPEEEVFLRSVRSHNPQARLITSADYLACVIP